MSLGGWSTCTTPATALPSSPTTTKRWGQLWLPRIHVIFNRCQEAKKAIREMNGATIAGQEIKVGWRRFPIKTYPNLWGLSQMWRLFSGKKGRAQEEGGWLWSWKWCWWLQGRENWRIRCESQDMKLFWTVLEAWLDYSCFSDASGRRLAGDLGRVGAGYGGHDGVIVDLQSFLVVSSKVLNLNTIFVTDA